MTAPDVSREDRLDELERRVRRLEEALLEARELVEPAATSAPTEIAPSRSAAAPSLALDVLAQTGWSVLALAGAFLVRALTDRGTMATTPGVALGLAYALGVFVLADRGAARGNRLTAAFLGATGAFIANAIVAETTTRFAIFSPVAGLGVLAAATALALTFGRRDDLPAIAWVGTLAACATAGFLALTLHVPALSGILLLAVAAAASWLSSGRWSWRFLAWPPTFGVVALSIWATSDALDASKGGVSAASSAMLLALGLAILWPATVLARALLARPVLGPLDFAQLVFALSAGLVAALLLAGASGGAGVVAASAAASSVGAYAFAFLRERAPEARPTRLYFAWLGLALLLAGSGVLLPDPAPALVWSALAVFTAAVARGFEPAILQAQSAVLAAAATVGSGLFVLSAVALTAGAGALRPATFPAVAALAAVTGTAALLLRERPAAGPLPAFAATLLSALGLGALAVLLLEGSAAAILPGSLPALRTIVVSLSAYALARLWRATGRSELRTLAYIALVAGGAKLLFEDVPSGRPLTLFVAFVFYGGALLLVPRTMRAASPAAAEERRVPV